jgi:hypothetical protein
MRFELKVPNFPRFMFLQHSQHKQQNAHMAGSLQLAMRRTYSG